MNGHLSIICNGTSRCWNVAGFYLINFVLLLKIVISLQWSNSVSESSTHEYSVLSIGIRNIFFIHFLCTFGNDSSSLSVFGSYLLKPMVHLHVLKFWLNLNVYFTVTLLIIKTKRIHIYILFKQACKCINQCNTDLEMDHLTHPSYMLILNQNYKKWIGFYCFRKFM